MTYSALPHLCQRSSAALPAHPKLPSGELKRGLFLSLPSLLHSRGALWLHLPVESRPADKNAGGKGEVPEGPHVLALLSLHLPSQRQNPLASPSSRTHEISLTRSGERATTSLKNRPRDSKLQHRALQRLSHLSAERSEELQYSVSRQMLLYIMNTAKHKLF